MSADPTALRFFADESALGVGKALEMARKDVIHPGHPLLPEVPLGTPDTDWIPQVSARGLIVISRDRHIRSKPAELQLLHQRALRVFWLAGRKDLSNWGYLVRLVRRWDDIEERIRIRGPGPWFYAVNESNLAEITLTDRSSQH